MTTIQQIVNGKLSQWPLSPQCTAPRHNMLKAARGWGDGTPPCICPHSLELLKIYKERRKQRYKMNRGGKDPAPKVQRPNLPVVRRLRETPHMDALAEGACRTAYGMRIMDLYTENPPKHQDAARRLCKRDCPVVTQLACLKWVTEAEQPAGSWHGMIAGLSRIERFKRAVVERSA